MSVFITDLENWRRLGRGKGLQFFATDEEVAHLLQSSLPDEYGPFSIVGSEMVKEGNKYIEIPFSFELEQFSKYRGSGFWQFFLRSHTLTPALPLSRGDRVDAILSLNGLVNLQQGVYHNEEWCDSSIGIVDKIWK